MAQASGTDAGNGLKDFHVVVVGAGAAGLLTAHGLQKHGIRYTLFEREPRSEYNVRPRDWSMGLHWARRLMPPLLPDHMARTLWKIDADPYSEGGKITVDTPGAEAPPTADAYPFVLDKRQETSFCIVNLSDNKELTWVGAETSRRASRRKLREFLRRDIDIQYGKKFARAEDGPGDRVTAFFEDGSSVTADLLVGADSGHSRVRPLLLPPEKNRLEYFPIRLYNFNARFTHEQAMFIRREAKNPLFWYGIHEPTKTVFTSSILDTPDPHDGSTWIFQLGFDAWDAAPESPFSASRPPPDHPIATPDPALLEPHKPSSAARLAEFRATTSVLCEPFRSAGQWVPDDVYISPDRISHLPVLHPWEGPLAAAGKVVLAGDAAHPMAPYRGQGLNNAVADAAELVAAVRRVVAAGAGAARASEMAAYGAEVRARGQREIDVSGRQAYDVHHLQAFMTSAVMTRGFHR